MLDAAAVDLRRGGGCANPARMGIPQTEASETPSRPAWWPGPAALRAGKVVAGWLAWLAASRPLILTVLAIALLWPGIARLPPLDRDEARTALATLQLLQPGEPAPPDRQSAGITWLQAGAVSLLSAPDRRDIWANRVPGALAALAAVLLTYRIAAVLYGPTAGFVAGLLLALSALLGAEARMATAEAPLLAAILLAQAALLEVWRRRDGPPPSLTASWVAPGVFWAAIGAGSVLNAPVVLLVTGGTLLGLAIAERRGRWMLALRPWIGLVALTILLPWIAGLSEVAHRLPPGSTLALFVLTFWPGSLFAAQALPWVWSNRRRPETRFLLAWTLPAWVVLEAVGSRLPHSVLPIIPAIATLTAGALCAPPVAARLGRLGRFLGRCWATLWLAVGLGLALAGPLLMLRLAPRVAALEGFAAMIAVVAVVQTARQAKRPAPRVALGFAVVAVLAISWSGFRVAAPALETIWLSPRIAAAVRTWRPCPDSVLASSSYAEPSLLYLAGRDTRLIGPARAAEFLHDSPACGLALIDRKDAPAFLDRARALGLAPRVLTRLDGINLAAMRRLELTLYAASPAAKPGP